MNTSSNATVAGKALEVAAAQITLEESIANPTLMGHKDNEDWLSTPDNTLWNNEAKSIYDPCPPGYRVPACNTEQPMWNSDLSAVAGWAVDAGNYWFKMGNPAAVFPFAGYRDDYGVGYRDDYGVGSMTHAYDRAVIWSAQNENDVKGKMLNVRGSSTHALGSAPKARAGSVRCVAIDENAPVPPVVPEYDPYVNLSKDASANSYIVDKAGDYKFKAVKGNSSEAVAAASAEVLWETWNNGEEVTANSVVASVEVKDGFVLFSTPETLKPGNAVIAAKDAAGVILWSWHIWVPATAIETGTYGLLDKALMDRNLGALVAATEADGAPVGRPRGRHGRGGRSGRILRPDLPVGPQGPVSGPEGREHQQQRHRRRQGPGSGRGTDHPRGIHREPDLDGPQGQRGLAVHPGQHPLEQRGEDHVRPVPSGLPRSCL